MKAIIPVAGHGTRLEPHTLKLQKCLLPVAGKPVIEHILDILISVGISEFTFIIGHFGEQVVQFTKKYTNVKFNFVKQEERLGLGHAIYQGLEKQETPIVIVLGDAILELDYSKLIENSNSVVGVAEVPDPERFGIVELDGQFISKFHEKPKHPPSNLAISGVYKINSQKQLAESIEYLMANDIRTKGEYQLTDALQNMLDNGSVFVQHTIDNCLDCGIPETLLQTNRILLGRINQNSTHSESKIENSKLQFATISKGCLVENSTLENVIMLPNSKVLNQNISDCIVGFNEILTNEFDERLS
ncbi:MAG: nucleotidyltransferase family protein [Candidatus Marinimicrobia bacterium]|nr:nucleotidyltransferase family protein [Candidatus Neomarinimicrobiota bacterium]MBL7023231.1 nucleotidyltransferase family protein [Candidatus Neomarinimicrobiota bacterium]MBL7110135.1 nucleotidyltransferase family protein [Candidatus Neomarinimicrobiota bacterium]